MNLDYLTDFLSKYDAVFDSEGNVKACGRRACIRLMEACHNFTGRPTTDFGNPSDDDGRMNVAAIKAVFAEVSK